MSRGVAGRQAVKRNVPTKPARRGRPPVRAIDSFGTMVDFLSGSAVAPPDSLPSGRVHRMPEVEDDEPALRRLAHAATWQALAREGEQVHREPDANGGR